MSFHTAPVAASAARTTTGNSGSIAASGQTLCVGAVVTAAGGTSPSLVLSVEWSFDGTNFGAGETPASFAAITAAKTTVLRTPVQAPYFRLVWTITGTSPSFTFSASSYTY